MHPGIPDFTIGRSTALVVASGFELRLRDFPECKGLCLRFPGAGFEKPQSSGLQRTSRQLSQQNPNPETAVCLKNPPCNASRKLTSTDYQLRPWPGSEQESEAGGLVRPDMTQGKKTFPARLAAILKPDSRDIEFHCVSNQPAMRGKCPRVKC